MECRPGRPAEAWASSVTWRAARSRSSVQDESRIVPSASWPLNRSVRGPAAAQNSGGGASGGQSSATSRSFT
jgi:hypothetical protein